jgi:hypothetical protein
VPSSIRVSAAVGTAAVDAQAADAAAHGTEPGLEQALTTAGSSSPGTALTQWGSQSAVADEAQLHDSVLRSVLGITLAQLQEGADKVSCEHETACKGILLHPACLRLVKCRSCMIFM